MNKKICVLAFLAGAFAVLWVGIAYISGHPLAFAMTLLIGTVYALGSLELLRFHQALVFACHDSRNELLAVSGLAKPTEDSPYLVWLERASRWVAAHCTEPREHPLAIVPIGYDPRLERYILIYGVLTSRP